MQPFLPARQSVLKEDSVTDVGGEVTNDSRWSVLLPHYSVP